MQRIAIYMVLCLLTFSSCTQKLFTQDQVLNTILSPKEMIARFGEPSEIRVVGKQTEYFYYYWTNSNKPNFPPQKRLGQNDSLSKNNKRAYMYFYGKPMQFFGTDSSKKNLNEKERQNFERRMKLVFSEDQKLIDTEIVNIDLNIRATNPVATFITVFGITFLFVGGIINAVNNFRFHFY